MAKVSAVFVGAEDEKGLIGCTLTEAGLAKEGFETATPAAGFSCSGERAHRTRKGCSRTAVLLFSGHRDLVGCPCASTSPGRAMPCITPSWCPALKPGARSRVQVWIQEF
eukprot:366181-Chlamydomonas_euryale.AAC.6